MKFKNNLIVFTFANVLCMVIFLSGYLQIRPINLLVNRHQLDPSLNSTNLNFVNKPTFKKCIVLLIDALRYDYFINEGNPNLKYLSHLKELYFANKDGSTLVYKFIADPPTTTTQRLRGLTVGSIPTFFDLKDVFSGSIIQEDNLLNQFNMMGKKVVFLGDDTWLNLFDVKTFHKVFPFPSFVVKDLHTVDNGVILNFDQILNSSDWDIIIAHFLGVDHCGHWLGIHDNEMYKKLQQMDIFINNITNVMDNETLLLVFGDHGSTNTGDHGGESKLELESLLFGYSKSKSFMSQSSHVHSVPQIDLVPTLAMLLGVPIPYSNIGKLIPDFFGGATSLDTYSHLAKLLHVNMLQVNQIIEFYNMNVDKNTTQALKLKYEAIAKLLNDPYDKNEKDILNFLFEFNNQTLDYLTSLQNMARKEWIEYNYNRLIAGLALLVAITICFLYVLSRTIRNFIFNHRLKKIDGKQKLFNGTNLVLVKYNPFENETGAYALILTLYVAPILALLSNSYIIHEATVNKFVLTSLLCLHLWLLHSQILFPSHGEKMLVGAYLFAILLCRFLYCVGDEFSFLPTTPRSDQIDKSKPETFPASPSHFLTTVTSNLAPSYLSYWLTFIFCCKVLTLHLFLYSLHYLLRRCGISNGASTNRPRDEACFVLPFLALALFWTSEALITFCLSSSITPLDNFWLSLVKWVFNQNSIDLIAVSGYLATRIVLLCSVVSFILPSLQNGILSDHQKLSFGKYVKRFALMVPTLLLVMREGYVPYYACLCLLLSLWAFINDKITLHSGCLSFLPQAVDFRLTQFKSLCLNALICYSLGQFGFFMLGHHHELSSIKWDSPFQGIVPGTSSAINSTSSPLAKVWHFIMGVNKGEPFRFVSAYMILLNTFSSQVTMIYLLPIFVLLPYRSILNVSSCEGKDNESKDGLKKFALDSLDLVYLLFLTVSHLKMLVSTIGIFIHRRHLMLWAIFFPRYIYATVEFFITALLFILFM